MSTSRMDNCSLVIQWDAVWQWERINHNYMQKHNVQKKKPDTKDYTQYDSIYTKFKNGLNYHTVGAWEVSQADGCVLFLNLVLIMWLFSKIHWAVLLLFVCFLFCTLFLTFFQEEKNNLNGQCYISFYFTFLRILRPDTLSFLGRIIGFSLT